MKNQKTTISVVECLLIMVTVVSLSFSLRYVNDNLSSHPLTKFIVKQVFSEAQAASNEYQAEIVEQSNYVVNLLPGKGYTMVVKFRNTGSREWAGDYLFLKSATDPSPVRHSYWSDSNTPLKTKVTVPPGETITLQFALQAPVTTGLFVERFGLTLGEHNLISGSLFELPINITSYPNAQAPRPVAQQSVSVSQPKKTPEPAKADLATTQPNQITAVTSVNPTDPTTTIDTQQPAGVPTVAGVTTVQNLNLLGKEPEISVGLYYPPDKNITITADGEFAAYINGVKQGNFGAGTMVRVQYLYGVYNLMLPSGTASFSKPITFKPIADSTILELPNYENRSSSTGQINYNRFAGSITIKYNPDTDRLWAINVLPLEDYVAGIAETSNINVPEFHKALAVAARSYALFYLLDNTRYNGFFHVHDFNDQIYRGINATRRLPLYVEGVNATAGQVITLNRQIVVAPYFTQSNGQTRIYTEVWGQGGGITTSHLVSVPVPQDVGHAQLGHGVGMSAQGAKRMAELESEGYISILQHFYTGVDISRVY